MKALVSSIQKFCVDDGPGIRTVVFLMGCPLRCKWCQNPENLTKRIKLMYDASKCVSCGACVPVCREGANTLLVTDGKAKLVFDRNRCKACGACVSVCHYDARDLNGKWMTSDEVYDTVMKDEVFFRNTGGGITLSGGECTTYPDFAAELFRRFRAVGIGTAVETSGYCSEYAIRTVAEYTDVFLYDIKAMTPRIHRKWIGQNDTIIKRNLESLLAMGKRVIIRIPLVPGVNDGDELARIAEYLNSLGKIKEVHILPFHQLGASKYALSGEKYELADMKECSPEQAQAAAETLEEYGFQVNIGGWNS